jgi:hypothetical protein
VLVDWYDPFNGGHGAASSMTCARRFVMMLTDYGISGCTTAAAPSMRTRAGTPGWAPPEFRNPDFKPGSAKPPAGSAKPPAGSAKPPPGSAKPPAGSAKPKAGGTKPPPGYTNTWDTWGLGLLCLQLNTGTKPTANEEEGEEYQVSVWLGAAVQAAA